jgi:hypothetical protein
MESGRIAPDLASLRATVDNEAPVAKDAASRNIESDLNNLRSLSGRGVEVEMVL